MNVLLTYRRRDISRDDISFIIKIINDNWTKGRNTISHVLCEAWEWRQANDQLKDGIRRGLLLHLERSDLIPLPPWIINNNNNSTRRKKQVQAIFDFQPPAIDVPLAKLRPLELRQVRKTLQ